MKRIKAACLCQTLHFMIKEDIEQDYAVKMVKDEVDRYKAALNHQKTRYRIDEETTQPDGSVILKIVKQYNGNDVGNYLNRT
jgi:hypothetical protein